MGNANRYATDKESLRNITKSSRPEFERAILNRFLTLLNENCQKAAEKGYYDCRIEYLDDFNEIKHSIKRECKKRGLRCDFHRNAFPSAYIHISWKE